MTFSTVGFLSTHHTNQKQIKMSKRVLNKMQGAFQSLGIELKESHTFYEFEYEHIQMLLSMEVKDQSFVFLTYVVDSNEISMDKNLSLIHI